jgi:hypothetical protein
MIMTFGDFPSLDIGNGQYIARLMSQTPIKLVVLLFSYKKHIKTIICII